ncbi:MAG: 1-acyl-sn-glycerol-3-phosphate acyltransferase [Chitinophagia bacterium]|jgi:1-acyl-sn-glycerol-3-phosphate acyltransferase|nr:1-acyl-sn-glycerol-3-phosphate acyltransferase [Chitinophagia bacterium]
MKKILKPIQLIYCLYAIIVFAGLTILSVLSMAFILPLGKEKLSNRIYLICRYWSKVLYFFLGVKHIEIYESVHDFSKPHIFVGNHNSYMDIPPIVQLKHQPIKPLGKFESSKIPIFGWIYKEAVVMVDRSNPEKRAQSLRNLKMALLNKVSIFIFPEGTFSMTQEQPLKSFFNGAFKLAIEMNTPIQPILLLDTVERMHFDSIFSLTPGKSRVVYLETVKVDGYSMDDVEALKSKVYKMMDEGLRRYRNYPTS